MAPCIQARLAAVKRDVACLSPAPRRPFGSGHHALDNLEMLRHELTGRLFHQQDLTIDALVHGVVSPGFDSFRMQFELRSEALNCTVVRCGNASWHRCAFHNENISVKRAKGQTELHRRINLPHLHFTGTYGGARMSSRFTQYILIAMALWHRDGPSLDFQLTCPTAGCEIAADINLIAMLFLRLIKMIIAPLVFATLGRRHRPYGLWRQARPHLRQTDGAGS